MVAMLGATSGSATSAASRVILLTSAQTREPLVCGGCRRSLLCVPFRITVRAGQKSLLPLGPSAVRHRKA